MRKQSEGTTKKRDVTRVRSPGPPAVERDRDSFATMGPARQERGTQGYDDGGETGRKPRAPTRGRGYHGSRRGGKTGEKTRRPTGPRPGQGQGPETNPGHSRRDRKRGGAAPAREEAARRKGRRDAPRDRTPNTRVRGGRDMTLKAERRNETRMIATQRAAGPRAGGSRATRQHPCH